MGVDAQLLLVSSTSVVLLGFLEAENLVLQYFFHSVEVELDDVFAVFG